MGISRIQALCPFEQLDVQIPIRQYHESRIARDECRILGFPFHVTSPGFPLVPMVIVSANTTPLSFYFDDPESGGVQWET